MHIDLHWGKRSLTLITEVFPGMQKMERKEKPLKKLCQILLIMHVGWCSITLKWDWSPISSLAILIRQALFWPADMHTVYMQEWCKRLKPVTQPVLPVWLVKTSLITLISCFDTFSEFSFSLHFSPSMKNLCYQGKSHWTCGDKLQACLLAIMVCV